MKWADKLEVIKRWDNAKWFCPRELEYLSMNSPIGQAMAGWDIEKSIHYQLDEIWSSLSQYSPKERVVMMIHPSGHHEVKAILER
ncbi:MAG TPA: hypothetical protein V6D19_05515 [Stenomitos sp.]